MALPDKKRSLPETVDDNGQVAERPMAADCKSAERVSTGVRIPPCPMFNGFRCGCSSMVEHLPSKQVRVGSIPITRSGWMGQNVGSAPHGPKERLL